MFRVGPGNEILISTRLRISRLEAVRDEIAGGDRWMELETCILEKELAALQEMLK